MSHIMPPHDTPRARFRLPLPSVVPGASGTRLHDTVRYGLALTDTAISTPHTPLTPVLPYSHTSRPVPHNHTSHTAFYVNHCPAVATVQRARTYLVVSVHHRQTVNPSMCIAQRFCSLSLSRSLSLLTPHLYFDRLFSLPIQRAEAYIANCARVLCVS
ncbi:hypothetical protein L226DRAFT_320831 [Lentinus tigrinus ALCF2SS1-7]|uniref:uncharacterized protein n=1 Tax=Lentinus tigrinus ALCF2SS1-7 TaxID=1328758 RepID=UPI00116629CC|nr:hypothetical protein L226DRAFT_320831 [Lentinus tigrinus ALCF2SS1-7]